MYEGTIAGKPVLLRIACEESRCAGYYFYEEIGEGLSLVQTAPNELDERLGVGTRARVTGHLSLATHVGEEHVSGTWRAAGKGPQPIELARVPRSGPPRALTRTFSDRIEEDRCHVRIRSFELVGLPNAEVEERLNALLNPEALAVEHEQIAVPDASPRSREICDGDRCSVSPKGYRMLCRDVNGRAGLYLDMELRPTLLDDKLISIRNGYDFDGGGAHPSDGVSGVTVDLRDGHLLDARDLLVTPSHEPPWETFVAPAALRQQLAGGVMSTDLPLSLGMVGREGERRPSIFEELVWRDFYLTPTGFELVPVVGEAMRVLRQEVQHVPFSRVRSALLPHGPASHLYER